MFEAGLHAKKWPISCQGRGDKELGGRYRLCDGEQNVKKGPTL